MIAFSSFRSFANCSPERREQYIQAHESWKKVFKRIVYFNDNERALQSAKTHFLPSDSTDGRPTIASMARCASEFLGWSAIINADIVVAESLATIETLLRAHGAVCALSRRWGNETDARPLDWGLDFFCATPEIWQIVANRIPKVFTLGRVRFDTWLCSFFCRVCPPCFDITPMKMIFHPTHEEREDQHIEDPDDWYLKNPAYPAKRLKL